MVTWHLEFMKACILLLCTVTNHMKLCMKFMPVVVSSVLKLLNFHGGCMTFQYGNNTIGIECRSLECCMLINLLKSCNFQKGHFGVGCKIEICDHAQYFGVCGQVMHNNLICANCMVTSGLSLLECQYHSPLLNEGRTLAVTKVQSVIHLSCVKGWEGSV